MYGAWVRGGAGGGCELGRVPTSAGIHLTYCVARRFSLVRQFVSLVEGTSDPEATAPAESNPEGNQPAGSVSRRLERPVVGSPHV